MLFTTLKLSLASAVGISAAIEVPGPVGLAAGLAAVIYLSRAVKNGLRAVLEVHHIALHGWKKLQDLPSREQLERVVEFAETSEGRLSKLDSDAGELKNNVATLTEQQGKLSEQAGANGDRLDALIRELGVPLRESDRRPGDRHAGDRRRKPRPA